MNDHLILWSGRSGPVAPKDENFFERNWSLAWVNFLLQEVGPYTLSSLENFEFEQLDLFRFVYLLSSLEGKLGADEQERLESFVQSGGTLIVEGAASNSLECPGIRFSSKNKRFRSLTSINRQKVPPRLLECLLRMPFLTRGWEIESKERDLEIILEMEGTPVFFKRAVGRGRVFSLGFDFGLLLVGLQQGIPVRGASRLEKLFGTQPRVIEPEDLVLKASLLDTSVPSADLFERFLFKVITEDEPAPRWWYFPNPYTGAFITSHDEEAMGADPRLEAMCREEKSEGIRGTLFVISDAKLHERWPDHGTLRQFSREAEIGLHWNRFQKPRFKFRSFKFGMHEESLNKQLEFLQKETGEPVRMNRTHYLAMGAYYGGHFESLAAGGICFDSTYGPNQGGRGYLFGTGYPYYGLTGKGSLSGVLELPFLTQETWGGADLSFVKRLLRESDENFHEVVMTNFHPHYTILQEEGRAMWRGGLDFAKERKQWCPTLGEFYQFFKKRSESSLRSRCVGGNLEVNVHSKQEEGILSFPAEDLRGRPFLRAEVDGISPEPRKVVNAWFEEILVPIPAGSHQIKVHYGP